MRKNTQGGLGPPKYCQLIFKSKKIILKLRLFYGLLLSVKLGGNKALSIIFIKEINIKAMKDKIKSQY